MDSGRHRTSRARWPLLGFGLGSAAVAAGVVALAVGLTQVAGGQACALAVSGAGGVSGIATHYVLQPGQGNCSFPFPPGDGLYVALSPSEYDNAAPCGSYLEVSGPDGSVRVEVADQCPPCAAGHIDLSATAFAAIAPLSAGLVHVSYQVIADPPLPGPLALRVKEGSSRYWLALLVMNTGNPLASVQVQTPSGGWTDLARASFNYWIAQSGASPGPFTVRLTDTLGHQATVRDVGLEPGTVQDTGAWMYGTGAVPSASAPPATSPASTASPAPATTAARRQGAHTHAAAAARPTAVRQAAARAPDVPTASRSAPRPSARPTC
jgi:expansin